MWCCGEKGRTEWAKTVGKKNVLEGLVCQWVKFSSPLNYIMLSSNLEIYTY
jgi:hypothetical protein